MAPPTATVTVRVAFVTPSLQLVKFQFATALAVSSTLVPTVNVPPPLTVPPLAGLATPVIVAVAGGIGFCVKFAVYVMFVTGTVTVRVADVTLSFQLVNVHPLAALATN